MHSLKFVVPAISLFLFPWLAFSQNPRLLTLDEAVRLGLENSKQLKISNSRIDVNKAKNLQYRYATIPSINASVNYTRISDNITPFAITLPNLGTFELNPQILNQFTNRLNVSQLIYGGDRAKNTFKSAEYLQKASELDYDKDKTEIRLNIVNACYNLYKLQESDSLLEENQKVLGGRATDINNFVKQGLAIENDALRAQLAISNVETSRIEVQNGIAVANYNLALVLGLPENTQFQMDRNSLLDVKEVAPLETYIQAAIAGRADLQAADWRQKAVEKSVQIAKGAYLPTVVANANVYYSDPNQRVFPPADVFKATWDVGVTVAYNFANLFSNKFNVQEAQVNLAQSGFQKDLLSDGIKMEVAGAYYAYQTALKKIALNELTIRQATENQRVNQKRYNSQISTLTDLLDADYSVLQSKINYTTAQADANNAYYRLLKATGK